jgi:hypothetical protein
VLLCQLGLLRFGAAFSLLYPLLPDVFATWKPLLQAIYLVLRLIPLLNKRLYSLLKLGNWV